jgi:hypothetical protein
VPLFAEVGEQPPDTPRKRRPAGWAHKPPELKSVQACSAGAYHLRTAPKIGATPAPRVDKHGWTRQEISWPTGEVGDHKCVPYKCGSRRHPGPCAEYMGRVYFCRIKEGLERQRREELSLLVLTLKHREWSSPEAAYLELYPLWRNLIKKIQRRWGELVPVIDKETGLQRLGRKRRTHREPVINDDGSPALITRGKNKGQPKLGKWISERRPVFKHQRPQALTVVEKHPGTGFPHLNIVLRCAQFAADLGPHEVQEVTTKSGKKEKRRVQTTPLGRATVEELKAMAVTSGFGYMLTASVVDDVEAVAGYMVKTAKPGGLAKGADLDVTGIPVAGELAKRSQVPDNAPLHFRAVRASPGFIAPLRSEGLNTGSMKFEPIPKKELERWLAEQEQRRKERPPKKPRRPVRRSG